MKVTTNGIKIELLENEVGLLWNIVAFAFDLQAERDKKGESCMTDDEKRLANELLDTLNNIQ